MKNILTIAIMAVALVLGACADANMNTSHSARNPLIQVGFMQNGTDRQLTRHIEAGTPLNVQNPTDGRTPLMYVLDTRVTTRPPPAGENMVRLMLDHGADPNLRSGQDLRGFDPYPGNETAMHYAAIIGHANIIRMLVAYGGEVNVEDDMGNVPLYLAIRSGRIEAVQALLEAGANPNYVDSVDRLTPLGTVARYSPNWRQYGIPAPNPRIIALVRQYGGHE